jgi:hypothetical protein
VVPWLGLLEEEENGTGWVPTKTLLLRGAHRGGRVCLFSASFIVYIT